MKVSLKLVEGVDCEGGFALYVVEGNPADGYELYRARLEHVDHYKRSWQAVAVAKGKTP